MRRGDARQGFLPQTTGPDMGLFLLPCIKVSAVFPNWPEYLVNEAVLDVRWARLVTNERRAVQLPTYYICWAGRHVNLLQGWGIGAVRLRVSPSLRDGWRAQLVWRSKRQLAYCSRCTSCSSACPREQGASKLSGQSVARYSMALCFERGGCNIVRSGSSPTSTVLIHTPAVKARRRSYIVTPTTELGAVGTLRPHLTCGDNRSCAFRPQKELAGPLAGSTYINSKEAREGAVFYATSIASCRPRSGLADRCTSQI